MTVNQRPDAGSAEGDIFMRPGAVRDGILVYDVAAPDWGVAVRQARERRLRWAGLWVEVPAGGALACLSCFMRGGEILLLRTRLDAAAPSLASHVPCYPAADRMERHARDLWGIAFTDHPDPRRWTRHQAWPADCYPLRTDAAAAGATTETPPDADYPFVQAQGSGVCEIPVGPVHAGIIEPGHFRFQAVGEDILAVEERLGYTHKGIEKAAVGRDAFALARLAGRVSGDSTVAHAWAACMAMEQAAGLTVPPRAALLRGVLLECERVANHLGDIAAICNDVGFSFAYYQFGRLREQWLRCQAATFGHRLLMDRVVPGGVAGEPDPAGVAALRRQADALRGELADIRPILEDHPSLEDRLIGTGVLAPQAAGLLGVPGVVGRASGADRDLRRDRPRPPYDAVAVTVPIAADGDVAARIRIRLDEIPVSLDLIARWLASPPSGTAAAPWPSPPDGTWGLGAVEGWRGDVLTYVRFGAGGRIQRFFPRDPSWFLWPALERLMAGNIVAEFPVCNKSVNASYSGHDL